MSALQRMARPCLSVSLATLVLSASAGVCAADKGVETLATKWRILDSKSGVIESVLEFRQEDDGTFSGYVVKSSPNPLINLYETCIKCPVPYKDQPIVGMRVLWGFKPDGADGLKFKDGHAFDPKNGKTYRGKIRLSSDQRRMYLRGYIGTSLLGRTEVWLRGDGSLTKSLSE